MHSEEPWGYCKGSGFHVDHFVITNSEMPAASPLAKISDLVGGAEADARRIVAAVNACAGIPDSILSDAAKDGVPVGQIEHLMMLIDKRRTAELQRDELLAALKAVRECFSFYQCGGSTYKKDAERGIQIIDSAIAKVEGKGDE